MNADILKRQHAELQGLAEFDSVSNIQQAITMLAAVSDNWIAHNYAQQGIELTGVLATRAQQRRQKVGTVNPVLARELRRLQEQAVDLRQKFQAAAAANVVVIANGVHVTKGELALLRRIAAHENDCCELLKPDHSVVLSAVAKGLIRKVNVRTICSNPEPGVAITEFGKSILNSSNAA